MFQTNILDLIKEVVSYQTPPRALLNSSAEAEN
jgi:hypothetical protein